MKRKILTFSIAFLLSLCTGRVPAQIPESRYETLEELLESLTEETDEAGDLAHWIEELQELHEHPVDLNKAGLEDLLKIPFLNEVSATNILAYREKYGAFFSVFELASIPGLSRELAEKISFSLTCGEERLQSGKDSILKRKGFHQILARNGESFPLSAGYRAVDDKSSAYRGSFPTFLVKYGFEKPGLLEAGITAEKDAGEPFLKKPARTGFDFYSGHVSFRGDRSIPMVTLGDFTVRTGQGLVLWQGFSLGKSSDVIQASRNMSQIRPYTSTDENRFFRGVAATLCFEHSKLNLFFSSKKSDGNLLIEGDSTVVFTSLQSSGYHRTLSEIADRKSVRHSAAGAFYTRFSRSVKIGFTVYGERFQYPCNPGDQLYEKFYFRGRSNFNLGSDYHWIRGKYHFFGEAALSCFMGYGFTQGMEAHLHDQLTVTLLYRHFSTGYHATWASAFAADSKANNESGWYTGIRILPAPKITLSAYADWYHWPWIKYTTASPATGFDYLLEANIRMNRRLTGYVRWKSRSGEEKISGDPLRYNNPKNAVNLRANAKYDFSNRISLGWRLEMNRIKNQKVEKGMLAFQDIIWNSAKKPLSAVFRISWFHTGSWNSRIYAYENDLLYTFSTFSFFGEGFRSYLKIKYSIMKNLDAWFKIAGTWYPDQHSISAGNSEISSGYKTELKIELRYRF